MDVTPSFQNIKTINISSKLQESPKRQCSQKSQRTPKLRKRKPTKKAASQKPLDYVCDNEILITSLPASSCRIINCKLRQTSAWIESADKEGVASVTASDGFHVKTRNTDLYLGELNFGELDAQPSSMCPFPEVHMERVRHGKDLPLACPTCWSLQRN